MNAVDLQDTYLVIILFVILVIGFLRSLEPKIRVSVGVVLVSIGAGELALFSFGSLLQIRSLAYPEPNSHFYPDYYGLTLFSPLIILLALATIGYGTWCLARVAQNTKESVTKGSTLSPQQT